MFAAVCDLGLEGIVSKKLNAPYRSGTSKSWIKIRNQKAPAATRIIDNIFNTAPTNDVTRAGQHRCPFDPHQ